MPHSVQRSPAGEPVRATSVEHAVSIADSLTMREWDELVTMVLRRLERRVKDDLVRRGRGGMPRVM